MLKTIGLAVSSDLQFPVVVAIALGAQAILADGLCLVAYSLLVKRSLYSHQSRPFQLPLQASLADQRRSQRGVCSQSVGFTKLFPISWTIVLLTECCSTCGIAAARHRLGFLALENYGSLDGAVGSCDN